jgi:hypothetical protein
MNTVLFLGRFVKTNNKNYKWFSLNLIIYAYFESGHDHSILSSSSSTAMVPCRHQMTFTFAIK